MLSIHFIGDLIFYEVKVSEDWLNLFPRFIYSDLLVQCSKYDLTPEMIKNTNNRNVVWSLWFAINLSY